MAYTDDAVRAKLSALNETQEGIVTVAQWVMFHRRHADRTAQLWLQKLRDSPANKKLNLIYLANEVAQQSKARRKEDFLIAFSPIIAEATAVAYKGSSNDIQQKLRRVVEVWRARSIFEQPIQEAIEARVDDIDKSRSSGRKPLLGGFLFSNSSGSIPSELEPLVPFQTALSKASMTSTTTISTANVEYDKLHDANATVPTPPVHAAKLSQLLKSLASAESSVSEIIKARQELITGLEKLLDSNRSALSKEEALVVRLSERKAETEEKKREVEDAIMRGFSEDLAPTENNAQFDLEDSGRPAVEALTPPPVESLTPTSSPPQSFLASAEMPLENLPSSQSQFPLEGSLTLPTQETTRANSHQKSSNGNQANGINTKKRKVTHGEDDYAQFASGDLDADVAELLMQESPS